MMYPITDETIRAIWRAHRLGAAGQIIRAASGVSNQCFVVDGARDPLQYDRYDGAEVRQ
jgi:hypothetical protein